MKRNNADYNFPRESFRFWSGVLSGVFFRFSCRNFCTTLKIAASNSHGNQSVFEPEFSRGGAAEIDTCFFAGSWKIAAIHRDNSFTFVHIL